MPGCPKNQLRNVYLITISGNLDPNWSSWFDGLIINSGQDSLTTTLSGSISDQAQLRGILNKLWDLNAIIISVNQIEDRILK